MRARSHAVAAGLLLVASLVASGPARAAALPPTGLYTAELANLEPGFSRFTTVPVRLWIDSWTPADRAQGLVDLLRGQGATAFADALWRHDIGRLQIDGRLGLPIAAAFPIHEAGRDRLILILNRPIAPWEFWRFGRSLDYRFTVLELDLGADGQGSGSMVGAAKLHVDKDSKLVVTSLGNLPLRLLTVRRAAI
ncbi:MAG: hypothetical protein ACM3OB_06255 [Acidobacteriota bacterium]